MTSQPAQARAFASAAMIAAAACMVAHTAAAQTYDFQLARELGSLNADISIVVPITGTLIGDHDPVTNPGGTTTRPNLFGSGNHHIPYTATLVADSADGGIVTQPAGQLAMDVDVLGRQVFIDDLFIDALNGAAPGIDATLNINYQTFYTSNPTDFFPGGITIPIPLGQITISTLTMSQIGSAAPGALTPLTGNQFALAATVDVEVLIEADFLGDPISPGVIPLTVLLTGTLTVIDAETAQLDVEVSLSLSETNDGPFDPFENMPFTIPGPLSGQPVNLLLNGVIQSVTVNLDVEANLIAHGTGTIPPCPPLLGDLNCDGSVGVADLLMLLAAWGPCADCAPGDSGGCPADLTGDCAVGVADLLVLLANWG